MATFPSFYETVTEANMRLRDTIITYDGEPYSVLCVTQHMGDVFRIYIEPTGRGQRESSRYSDEYGPPLHFEGSDSFGEKMDEWLEKYGEPKFGVLRKKMNSPKFNKFRPFALGMANSDKGTFYVERHPNRRTEQGLTPRMLISSRVCFQQTEPGLGRPSGIPDLYGPDFRDCVLGLYPDAQTCLSSLRDPDVTNDSAAFHRCFAFVRGPFDLMFLAYKTDIIGLLTEGDFSVLRISSKFRHCAEVCSELNLFNTIKVD